MNKNELRQWGYRQRRQQTDKEHLSRQICQQFFALDEYQAAETIMFYLHCRTEVCTQRFVQAQLNTSKQVVVPYCTKDESGNKILGLWRLTDFDELVPGMWGILEPPRQRWAEPGKQIDPQTLDLIMVPGVVFDKKGGRLGNGAGYYDRLLLQVRDDACLVGVCFESQLAPQVPMDRHDVFMDYVITEKAVYSRKE